jgi:hypothetical protein
MWLTNDVITETERLVRVFYVDKAMCRNWNEHRSKDDLRLLSGWCWVQKGGNRAHAQGFKTRSVCLRDAYYTVVKKELAPGPITPRLKLIKAAA